MIKIHPVGSHRKKYFNIVLCIIFRDNCFPNKHLEIAKFDTISELLNKERFVISKVG